MTRPGMAARREKSYIAQALAKLGVPILRTIAGDGIFEGANAMWVTVIPVSYPLAAGVIKGAMNR